MSLRREHKNFSAFSGNAACCNSQGGHQTLEYLMSLLWLVLIISSLHTFGQSTRDRFDQVSMDLSSNSTVFAVDGYGHDNYAQEEEETDTDSFNLSYGSSSASPGPTSPNSAGQSTSTMGDESRADGPEESDTEIGSPTFYY